MESERRMRLRMWMSKGRRAILGGSEEVVEDCVEVEGRLGDLEGQRVGVEGREDQEGV